MKSSIRRWVHSLLLSIGAIGLMQCVDSAGPRSEISTFGVTPVWNNRASHALGVLDEGGFPLDRVRIILVRPASDTLKDTTITFRRSDPAIDLALTVRVVPGVLLDATLQFKSGETLLYEGKATVETVPLTRIPTPFELPMEYLGPGSNATSVVVTPASGKFTTAANVIFTGTAFDGATALAGTPLSWTIDDATMGAFTAGGVFTPSGKSGPVTVTATTPTDIAGSATVTLVAPSVPTGLTIASGDGQTAIVQTALPAPFVAKVTDQFGDPMSGVTVTWTPLTSGGLLSSTTSTTGASGLASVVYTLGSTPGDATVRASVTGISSTVTFTAHGVVGTPASITVVSGNGQSATILQALPNPFVAKVLDASGNPVSGATVTWTRVAGFGTPATATSTTNASGLASLSYHLGDIAGTETVTASVAGVATPATFNATTLDVGPVILPIVTGFAYLKITPTPITPRVGDTISFTVDSIDAKGTATSVTALWASSNPGRGAVDATGKLIVADTGALIITATRNAIAGHAQVTVLPAPKVTAFSFAPKTLSGISTNALTASFTFTAQDAGTGVTSATLTLTGPTGATQTCTFGGAVAGSAKNGVFECALTLPVGSAAGVWHVTSLVVNGSITRTYGESVLALFGPTTLTINP
jgi:hypothetical protein